MNLFYNTFGLEHTPFIFLCGNESLEVLSTTLSRELEGQNKTTLVLSDSPMVFPVEGQVLIGIHSELLKKKVETETPRIYYLCSEVKNDLLLPVEPSLLPEFILDLPENVTVLSLITRVPPFIREKELQNKFIFINVFGLKQIEEHLSKFIGAFEQHSDVSFTENLQLHWQKWVANFCPRSKDTITPLKRILFLNHVKSLIDENRIIPIVRNLNELYDQVFIGDINEYKLKEI
ncbi:hypothetical protein DRI50_10200 [candidate division KSB1 bacterium]|nr:MAG: hypothetical protein DRI50_10200 [candidate division KSB1 bacterium]